MEEGRFLCILEGIVKTR